MPGSVVTTIAAPPVNGAPTDTGTAYIAEIFEQGPTVPQLITSITGAAIYGADTAYTSGATHLEAYFRLGGRRAWVNRIVGPTPVYASITLNGSGALASVKFTAATYGDWANNLRVAVIAGSPIKLVLSATTGPLATSPITSADLADKAAVLAYTGFSAYGAFTSAGAGTTPIAVAAANLTGGTDDHASITDTQRTTALTAFTRQKGPGQVLLPGDTRALAAGLLGVHAAAFNRVGLYDLPDDPSAASNAAAALALRTDANAAKIIAVEPWVKAPAAISGGALRDLPYSIVQAATIARQDALTGNPNEPAAADNGIAGTWIDSLKYQRTDAEIETLTANGANVATDLYGDGSIRMFGNRTLTNPLTNTLYLQASNVRLDMMIIARGRDIADRFEFKQIDGKGQLAARYGGALTNMLKALPDGALFAMLDVNGDEIDPGYHVDTSTGVGGVNTPATMAAMQLLAVIAVRRSPGSEFTYLSIVNYPTTQEFS
jgi:hypothetical protein